MILFVYTDSLNINTKPNLEKVVEVINPSNFFKSTDISDNCV